MIGIIQLCIARRVCFHVAHITLVPRGCIWRGVRLIGGIKMPACGTSIGCAAIAKFMYMKAVFAGRKTRELCVDLHAITAGSECDGAAHFVACGGMQHRNAF